jgi:TIR domain-containing protein
MQTEKFDVFLSHNGEEKPSVIAIGDRLRERGLRVWLDAWELRPGLSWQDGILQGLSCSASCSVMIGRAGYGGWHKREMEAALLRQGPDYPVIPVLLPGAPDRTHVNAFLSLLTWVDFRAGTDDEEALDRLIWGITGLRPTQPSGPSASATNSQFRILNPKNGDLLNGPSIVAGIGPPDEDVFLHYRSPDREDFFLGPRAKTDETGRWVMLGPESPWHPYDLPAGPYELYAAGFQDRTRSHLVTIWYRDSSNVDKAAQRISRRIGHVEISYELCNAFIDSCACAASSDESGPDLECPGAEASADGHHVFSAADQLQAVGRIGSRLLPASGLRAAHKEALLDDLPVLDRIKADFVEVHAFLALRRDFHLEANNKLIAVHIGTLDLGIVHLVVRIPPLAFSFDRFAPFEHRHVTSHRLTAHDVIRPEFLTGGVEVALRAHVGESLRKLLRIHDVTSFLRLRCCCNGPL